jgi:hypothetical protein
MPLRHVAQEPPRSPEDAAPVKYRNRVLTFLATLSVLTYLDRVCISVPGLRIQNELHLSPQDWGLVTGAFAIAYALFEIPSGYPVRAPLIRQWG